MPKYLASLWAAALLVFALAACTDPISLPAASVESASLEARELSIVGEGFFQYLEGQGMRVEVCGVTLDAALVEPAMAEILLPPAGIVRVQLGDRLTVTLPEGLQPGDGDVRIIRPDGQVVMLEDAIECPTAKPEPEPGPEPEPEPEPEPVPAVAVINADVTEGQAPLIVNFDAAGSSGEGALAYGWDFDDDVTADAASVTHTFEDLGEYLVTLTIAGEDGDTDTATQLIRVIGNRAPTARITYSVTHPEEEAPFALLEVSAETSSDPDDHVLTYAWYDLDESAEGVIATALTMQVPLPYGQPLRLRLVVTDTLGASDAHELTIMLDAPETMWSEVDPTGFPGSEFDQAGSPELAFDPADHLIDVTVITWEAHDGKVTLTLESLLPFNLPPPGGTPACEEDQGDVEDGGIGVLHHVGHIGIDIDRDRSTGIEDVLGWGSEYFIMVLSRREDGALPLVSADVELDECEVPIAGLVQWVPATVNGTTLAFTFNELEGRGADFDISGIFGPPVLSLLDFFPEFLIPG